MKEIPGETDKLFDSWLEESCFFVRFLLGQEADFKELIKDVVSGMPLLDGLEKDQKKAIFFKELEKVSCEKKRILSSSHFRQLELFAELDEHSIKPESYEKEIGVCRVRACLHQLNMLKELSEIDNGLFGNKTLASSFVKIAHRLLSENFFYLEDLTSNLSYARHNTICLYLLELLSESEAVEVEKKCRESPDWQRDKVQISKIVGWFEMVLETFDVQASPITNTEILELKPLMAEKFIYNEASKDPVVDISACIPLTSKVRSENDLFLQASFLVGLLATLIGSLGWLEQRDKVIEPLYSTDDEVSQLRKAPVIVDLDDISQRTIQQADQVANKVLALQTGAVIRQLEKQIKVPRNLLPYVKENEMKTVDASIETSNSFSSKNLNHNWDNKVHRALQSGVGYIFRPDKEALGKIIDFRLMDGKFFFIRADSRSPQASYVLSVQDYEVRMGTDESGFLILRGEVSRVSYNSEGDSSFTPYYLEPESAWWLDSGQLRTEIALDFIESD